MYAFIYSCIYMNTYIWKYNNLHRYTSLAAQPRDSVREFGERCAEGQRERGIDEVRET